MDDCKICAWSGIDGFSKNVEICLDSYLSTGGKLKTKVRRARIETADLRCMFLRNCIQEGTSRSEQLMLFITAHNKIRGRHKVVEDF
jgi:hypothetical protein